MSSTELEKLVVRDTLSSQEKAPDQHEQYRVALELLAEMGIYNFTGEEIELSDGDQSIVHKYDILNRLKPCSDVMRLYGKEGEMEKPLGYSMIKWAPERVKTSRKSEEVTEKTISSGNARQDGAVVSDLLYSYRSDKDFLFDYSEETGRVRVSLPTDQFDSHNIKIGEDRIVGLEFRPVIQPIGDRRSEFNHGQIAFLALPVV